MTRRRSLRLAHLFVAVGALSPLVRAADAPGGTENEKVVALPPFLVEAVNGRAWRHAESPEFEILARCSDRVTREIADNYHRLYAVLDLILPPRFQLRQAVPKTLLLYDEELLPATAQEMMAGMARANATPVRIGADSHYSVLSNPRLADQDAMTVFVTVPRAAFDFGPMQTRGLNAGPGAPTPAQFGWKRLTPDYIGYLLGNRVPALPTWFISGFIGLYRQTRFYDDAVDASAMVWVSERVTREVRSHPAEAALLLPMPELLNGPMAGNTIDRWMAQAELLVRWGLDDARRREAFWQFVDRSSREPVTEAMFAECFGFDFARGREELAAYLPRAVTKTVEWSLERPAKMSRLDLRDATAGEIARIKGEWERLAANYARANSPSLEPDYLAQARRTLRRAYDRGERDPRLLAEFGLCECDAGNDAGAREFLEQAAQGGGLLRPRACLELARLRFDACSAHPQGGEGKLDAAQAAEVLAPLEVARRQAPPLPSVYVLIAKVWSNCAAAPPAGDLAALDEGVALFRQDADLLYRTAALYAAQGNATEADRLVETGLRIAPNDAARGRFAELRDQLRGR